MKKLIASVLSGVLLAIACAGLANAAVLDRDTPAGSALVRTSCEVDYSVVIPADMEIPFGSLDTEIGRVYADVMKIEKGKAVYVEVDSQKAYNLVNTANAAYGIAYALAGADAICFNRVNDPIGPVHGLHNECGCLCSQSDHKRYGADRFHNCKNDWSGADGS